MCVCVSTLVVNKDLYIIVYIADHWSTNKGQQGMLREGTSYAAVSTCDEASYDGRDDVVLHRGVGIHVDAQITY